MKLFSIPFLLVAVTLGAWSCQAPRQLTEADIEALRNTVEGYVQAVRQGAWDEAAAYFADDAVRLPTGAPAERGKEAIRNHFNVVDSVPEWTLHGLEIEGSGDLAYFRFFFTITAYVGGGAEPFSYTGKQLGVARRGTDGTWLIVTDMWNSDSP
ncbi:MAG: DUF4440 domain-containing protein [Gemmatimonadales bacterium]|nr:DUF4440 domain-containing protein [Gemmatimonadales bacterium]